MDKYQEYILKKIGLSKSFIFSRCCPIEDELDGLSTEYGVFDKDNDTFIVTQDDDITKTQYVLALDFENIEPFESISVCKKNKWEKTLCIDNQYKIVVDFNNRVEAIKFSFKNNIADDYMLNLKFIETDKDKYLQKKEQERKAGLLKAANINVSTGADLVNIYFQPCCDAYNKTEIILYKGNMMLAKYDVDEDCFFKSISGLAYGKYEFILKQYDVNGGVILETDKIIFSIIMPNYSGKHTVII